MAKKQQIILLHGNKPFVTEGENGSKVLATEIAKGELVVEHGSDDVMIHTVDDSNNVATFVSKKYVDKEIAGINSELENEIATKLDELDAAIKKEAEDRDNADIQLKSDLESTIATEKAALEAADKTLQDNIDAEAEAREVEDGKLQAAIEAEAEAREEGDQAILDKIGAIAEDKTVAETIAEAVKAEEDARKAAVEGLQGLIDGEISAREAAVKAEEDARKVADEALDGKITTEKTEREAADKTLQDNIDAEAATRAAADAALEAKITAVEGDIDTLVGSDYEEDGKTPKSIREIARLELAAQLLSGEAEADFETLQQLAAWLEDHPEEVADINKCIGENATAIANLNTALDAEKAEREDDVEGLNTAIATEKTARENADKAILDKIGAIAEDKTVAETIAEAVAAEKAERQEEDGKLQASINSVSADLDVVEAAYVKQVVANGKTYTPENNILDLSEFVVDGGEY